MPEALELTLEEVIAAGRVLFGPAFSPDGRGWREELKRTYRRRALETHPDRARATGRSEGELAAEFRRVAEAYRVLSALRAGPVARPPPAARTPPPRARRAPPPRARAAPPPRADAAPPPRPRPAPPPRAAPPPPPDPRAAAHPRAAPRAAVTELPRRRLRFAEYLYYTGRVPWTAFVEAIAWQRAQRPPVGRIAVEWGFLDPADVAQILERRRVAAAQRIPFGEFAVRLGYLTSFQLLAMLGRQLRLQKRIGEFFVERGYVTAEEIDAIRYLLARHNARWRE